MDEEVKKLQERISFFLEDFAQCIITNGDFEDDKNEARDGGKADSLDAFKQRMQAEIQKSEGELEALKERRTLMENEGLVNEAKMLEMEKEDEKKALENERVVKENEELRKEIIQMRLELQERDDALMEIHRFVCRMRSEKPTESPSPSTVLSSVRRYFREHPPISASQEQQPHLIYSRSAPSHKGFIIPTQLKRSPSTEFVEVSRYLKDQRLKGENEAREWIENVTQLSIDGDLMDSVTSGRVLCKLVNAIKPGTIKKIHETPNTPIMQMQNISSFLHGCEILGVRKSDLFDATDLFQKKNATGVISTIHALGRVSQNVKGFKGPYLTSRLPNDKGRDSPEYL